MWSRAALSRGPVLYENLFDIATPSFRAQANGVAHGSSPGRLVAARRCNRNSTIRRLRRASVARSSSLHPSPQRPRSACSRRRKPSSPTAHSDYRNASWRESLPIKNSQQRRCRTADSCGTTGADAHGVHVAALCPFASVAFCRKPRFQAAPNSSLDLSRALEQRTDFVPQRETFFPFLRGQPVQGIRLAQPGQVGVGPPMRQRLLHQPVRSGTAF